MDEKIPALVNIVKVFDSWSKAQEILFLLHGLKEVLRQGFYDAELKKVEDFCQTYSLCLVKSNFKVILSDSSIDDDKKTTENKITNYDETTAKKFSNLGLVHPGRNNHQGMHLVYISKDEKKAHLAAYYEQTNNQKELGLILGYPACCVDYFCHNFSAENNNLEMTSDNPFTNLAHREEDCVLISHFPCRADCQDSITLGQKNLELLKRLGPERAKVLLSVLNV